MCGGSTFEGMCLSAVGHPWMLLAGLLIYRDKSDIVQILLDRFECTTNLLIRVVVFSPLTTRYPLTESIKAQLPFQKGRHQPPGHLFRLEE